MKPKQHGEYWRKWGRVRKLLVELGEFSKEDADAERHEIHRRALKQDKSSKKLTNADLDKIFDAFDAYLVLETGTTSDRSGQPVKRLIWAIEHLGLDEPYIASIAADTFKVEDWRSLDLETMQKLRFTLTRRRLEKNRKAQKQQS